MTAPARLVLDKAASARREEGNENLGFLSEEHGLLPVTAPQQLLPATHRVWDHIAAELPELLVSVTARPALEAMPRLGAGADVLPDRYLLRAASLLGHFAHSYVRSQPDPPEQLPASITAPWQVVCRRLEREHVALTYDDLVSYNWRLVDSLDTSRRVENLAVLTPTAANREETVFYMTQVEILARTAPVIGCMARAQEAMIDGDEQQLASALATIIDLLDDASRAFLKIDANPHSPTYVDPIVWAKTVAPFAVAIQPDQQALSGAAAPVFQVLDVFLGRRTYDSRVGRESRRLRSGFPPNLRRFMAALADSPVSEQVAHASPRTRGLWDSLLDVYAGDRGFLGVHRRKAYAYLELAFKVGRSVTTGGFSGLFTDQTWEVANRELEASRLERWHDTHPAPQFARADAQGPLHGDGLAHLRLDLADAALRFRPGDRIAIRPRNSAELVDRTIRALRTGADTPIRLDGRWRMEVGADTLSLRELLEQGQIRPVERPVAKALLVLHWSERLRRIVNARAETAWELWDLLELLASDGFDPRTLWQADPWEPHSLPRIVPPLSPRLYSAASTMDGGLTARRVELLAAELRYAHVESDLTPGASRVGTGCTYLQRLAESGEKTPVGVRVVPAPRFRLPDDPRRPIVMLAGGAGISPFLSFIKARSQASAPGLDWLLLSTRSSTQRDIIASQLTTTRFDSVVTSGDPDRSRRGGIVALLAEHGRALSDLAYGDAVFYVCGSAGFAATVVDELERLTSRTTIRTMIASGRLQQDVFTSGQLPAAAAVEFNATDVAVRNDADAGFWTIIEGGVYDLTEFLHRHPGGAAILREVAGRDGSQAFRQIEHHLDPEIEASLPMYRVGTIRRLDFGRRGAVAIGDAGLTYVLLEDLFGAWARYLHLVVEIQNAVRHDFGILDTVAVGRDDRDMTFLEAQLLVEAHLRFTEVYLAALTGSDLERLFALSAAFVGPEVDVRELHLRLEEVAHRPAAQAAAANIAATVARLRTLGRADTATRDRVVAEVAGIRGALEGADFAMLAALKMGISTGLRSFEQSERATPETAGPALLAPLRDIPLLVSQLNETLAAVRHPS